MREYVDRDAAIRAVRHAWAKGLEPSQYIEGIEAADVVPALKWTDAKTVLPTDGQRVLVYFNDYITDEPNIAIARHTENGWRTGRICPGDVHYWAPLPEPPKEDNDG